MPKKPTKRKTKVDGRTLGGRSVPPKGRHGPATQLTEELVDEFRRVIPRVYYLATATSLLGVSEAYAMGWVRRGRNEYRRWNNDPMHLVDAEEELCMRFYLAYREGMAEAEKRHLGNIDKAGRRAWQASAWVLERRHPDRWGSNVKEMRRLQKQLAKLQQLLLSAGVRFPDDEVVDHAPAAVPRLPAPADLTAGDPQDDE